MKAVTKCLPLRPPSITSTSNHCCAVDLDTSTAMQFFSSEMGVTALPNCSCATLVVEVCAVQRECGSYGNALSVSTPVVKVLATKQASCDGIEKKICKANSKPVSSSPR